PQLTGCWAHRRAAGNKIRRHGPGPAVEQEDGLVRVRAPLPHPDDAGVPDAGLRRQPPAVQAHPVARSQPDALATERVDRRRETRLVRPVARRVEEARRGPTYHRPPDSDPRVPPPSMPRSTYPWIGSRSRVNSVGITN